MFICRLKRRKKNTILTAQPSFFLRRSLTSPPGGSAALATGLTSEHGVLVLGSADQPADTIDHLALRVQLFLLGLLAKKNHCIVAKKKTRQSVSSIDFSTLRSRPSISLHAVCLRKSEQSGQKVVWVVEKLEQDTHEVKKKIRELNHGPF